MKKFSFKRDLPKGKHKISDVFDGLENIPELKNIFGADIEKVYGVVLFITDIGKWGEKLEYAYINNGEVHIGSEYIKNGPKEYIYLDMIHELTHIKQHWDGQELFDENFSYVDRPTEIEAYKNATEAARRIGMNYKEISEYLEVPWASEEEMARLEKTIGLN